MKRALVITGLAFMIGMILLASSNYLIVGRQFKSSSNIDKMKIDAVLNRNQDVRWVINRSVEEAKNESSNCQSFAGNLSQHLDNAFSTTHMENEWKTGPANLVSEKHSVVDSCPDSVELELNSTTESSDGDIHKELKLQKSYNSS